MTHMTQRRALVSRTIRTHIGLLSACQRLCERARTRPSVRPSLLRPLDPHSEVRTPSGRSTFCSADGTPPLLLLVFLPPARPREDSGIKRRIFIARPTGGFTSGPTRRPRRAARAHVRWDPTFFFFFGTPPLPRSFEPGDPNVRQMSGFGPERFSGTVARCKQKKAKSEEGAKTFSRPGSRFEYFSRRKGISAEKKKARLELRSQPGSPRTRARIPRRKVAAGRRGKIATRFHIRSCARTATERLEAARRGEAPSVWSEQREFGPTECCHTVIWGEVVGCRVLGSNPFCQITIQLTVFPQVTVMSSDVWTPPDH
ncbi:uncharacterized protein LOC144071817 [Stigmatopora argus]